jgi:hypothetical protein
MLLIRYWYRLHAKPANDVRRKIMAGCPYSLHEVNSPGRLAAAPPGRSRCPAIHPARSDRTGRTSALSIDTANAASISPYHRTAPSLRTSPRTTAISRVYVRPYGPRTLGDLSRETNLESYRAWPLPPPPPEPFDQAVSDLGQCHLFPF